MGLPVSFEDIEKAAESLSGKILRTPAIEAPALGDALGVDLSLKLENLQRTGSFKARGAYVKLASLSEAERARGVIAMSAGNHAQGVAYHAQRLGIPVVIVMPRHTPGVKIERTRAYGAEVILHGDLFDDARLHAVELSGERGLGGGHINEDRTLVGGRQNAAFTEIDFPDVAGIADNGNHQGGAGCRFGGRVGPAGAIGN